MEQKPFILLIIHLSFFVAKQGTRFGVYGDVVTHSLLQTFTEWLSCFMNERKHLPLWSFQSSHRTDKMAYNRLWLMREQICARCQGNPVCGSVWLHWEEGRRKDAECGGVGLVWEGEEWEMRLSGQMWNWGLRTWTPFFSVVNRRSGWAFLGGRRRTAVITINLGTRFSIPKQLFIFPILFNSCCNLVK